VSTERRGMSPLSETLRSATDSPPRSATARASRRREIEDRIGGKTGPAGKEIEIGCTRSVAGLTVSPPDLDERRPVVARKAIDPDTALVEQLRRQDAGAAEALVGTYWDRVYRLAIRITGNPSDAEEVVQDALWAVSRKIDTFRGVAAFGTWLYRITANTAYQKLRRRRSTRDDVSWEDLAPSFDSEGQHVETPTDWLRRLQDPAIGSELRAVLNAAIGELSAIYRTIFILHDVDGFSNAEIAEALQLKASTIKTRVYRTRLLLRNRLADYMGGIPSIAQVTRSTQ
jgi:RNA polymerase sigma-70 factor, ECF subfamily